METLKFVFKYNAWVNVQQTGCHWNQYVQTWAGFLPSDMTLIWDVTRVAFSRVQAIPPSLCCSSNLRLTAEVGEGSRYADVFFPNATGRCNMGAHSIFPWQHSWFCVQLFMWKVTGNSVKNKREPERGSNPGSFLTSAQLANHGMRQVWVSDCFIKL